MASAGELRKLLDRIDQAMALASRLNEYKVAQELVKVGGMLAKRIAGLEAARKRK